MAVVVTMIMIAAMLGLQMLPEAMTAVWMPYWYGTALVLTFWVLRIRVREMFLK